MWDFALPSETVSTGVRMRKTLRLWDWRGETAPRPDTPQLPAGAAGSERSLW